MCKDWSGGNILIYLCINIIVSADFKSNKEERLTVVYFDHQESNYVYCVEFTWVVTILREIQESDICHFLLCKYIFSMSQRI